MTSGQKIVGFVATLVIAIVLFTAILSEPYRQSVATQEHIMQSINSAMDVYVDNCLECHGPNGEGQDVVAALNSDNVRLKDPDLLYASIERGRAGTDMAAFGINEGGMLTNVQIDSLVLLIQYGNWDTIHARVAQLDMLPTATQTLSPTPTMTSTGTPSPMPTQNTSGVFEIMPSATVEHSKPPFEIVPTKDEDHPRSIFDVVATDAPKMHSDGPFDVLPTNRPQHDMPFNIVPTPTQSR